jgi:hypothetical protein
MYHFQSGNPFCELLIDLDDIMTADILFVEQNFKLISLLQV